MLDKILSSVVEGRIPVQLSRTITRLMSKFLSSAIQFNDWIGLRSSDHRIDLKIIDGSHGGIPLWDWLLLPGGGLWYELFWPTVIGTTLHRANKYGISAVLEIDGYTFENMTLDSRYDLNELKHLCDSGQIEITNGTYTQPFFQTISEESCIRQFSEGLDAIQECLGIKVVSYGTQEPSFCVQLPQILKGFGFQNAILRTHWAAFGTEPAFDTDYFNWASPNGTHIRTIPRYSTLDYSNLVGDINHPGIVNGGLAIAGNQKDYLSFQKNTLDKGIVAPVWTQFVDVFESPSKISQIKYLKPVTVKRYFSELENQIDSQDIFLNQDDLPQPLPWGLHADELIRHRSQAEKALLMVEHEDADLFWRTGQTKEKEIQKYWRQLLFTQHHDLQVCGAWWSQKHQTPLINIGIEYCRSIMQGVNVLKSDNPYSKNVVENTRRKFSETPTVSITQTGELTVIVNNMKINLGGYYTLWKDNKVYDSRESIELVRQVDDKQWIIEGTVSTIRFTQKISLSDQIDIDVTFDFGDGQLFGPQEPVKGYHLDHSKKLCVVYQTPPDSIIVRNSPFFFEETYLQEFVSLSWVGVESSLLNYAIISQEPAGFYFDRAMKKLYRALAWSPASWLYDSDDSITRNGHKHLAITGRHSINYSVKPYQSRVDVVQVATNNVPQKLNWLKIVPKEIIATALFVRNRRLYLRLWNPASHPAIARIEIDDNVECYLVNLNLQRIAGKTETQEIKMKPWEILTLEIEKSGDL